MTSTATPTAAPPLSAAICSLCQLLGHRGDERLMVRGRTPSGVGELAFIIQAEQSQWVPAPILRALEEGIWSLRADLIAQRGGAALVGAVPVYWLLAKAFRNPHDPASPHGRQWVRPDAEIQQALDRLAACPVNPSAVLVGGGTRGGDGYLVVGLFGLIAPIDVGRPAGVAQLRELRARLSALVGADAPTADEDIAHLTVPVPGSRVRELQNGEALDWVECLAIDSTRRYTAEQLLGTGSPVTTSTRPRRAAKESV